MSTRALYLAAGVAWGAILGTLVGLAAFVFASGIGWLYIFGDDTWPAASEWVLPLLALLAGLATFAACVAVGWHYGRRAVAAGADRRRVRRAGLALLGLWAVTAVALVVMASIGVERQLADRQTAEAQEAAFSRLSAARHTVDRVDFFGWNADSGSAGIVMRGNRDGAYQVQWQLTEPNYGRVLAEGRESVTLGLGRQVVVIRLDRASLIAAYRDIVLAGAGGVVVDEAFRLTATVEPVPSPAERATLPLHELQNLVIGQSTLRSTGEADVPMSFRLSAAPNAHTD